MSTKSKFAVLKQIRKLLVLVPVQRNENTTIPSTSTLKFDIL